MTKALLLAHIPKLVRPLVRLCLRHGVKLGELVDALKRAYIVLAEDELHKQGDAVSTSRITLMTGVHRTDVAEIRNEGSFTPKERHTASDVINQWRYDPRFSLKRGRPRALVLDGKNSEFAELVKSVSLSVSPYTVSFELERMGLMSKSKDGKVKLLTRAFVPKGDPSAVLDMLAEDADDLFSSVEENAFYFGDGHAPNHHLKTEYSDVPDSALPLVRDWLWREGSALHERARNFLSRYDRDSGTGDATGPGRNRVAIGSFSLIEAAPTSEVLSSKNKKDREA